MYKKLTIILMLIFFSISIIGCSNAKSEDIVEVYHFRGESKNWKATYSVVGYELTLENRDRTFFQSAKDTQFELSYKGEQADLASCTLEYDYKTSVGSNHYSFNFGDKPTQKTFVNNNRIRGAGIEEKDEIIEVTVKLNDKVEVIELKSN